MSLADQDFDQWRAMGEWAGAASDSLRAAGIYGDVVEGDYSTAAAEVGEWMAEEALSEGFAEVLERTVRDPGFDLRMGTPGAGAAWSGAVADVLAGQVMDTVMEPVERQQERIEILVDTQHQADVINDAVHVGRTLASGGLSEHGHFEELPGRYETESERVLGRQDERPYASQLPEQIEGHMDTAFQALRQEPVEGDIGFQFDFPPITREPAIDSFGDFARPMGGTEIGDTDAVHFDLDVGDRLGVNMRPDLEDHVMDYVFDAQVRDGRDIDFNSIAGPVDDTVEAAGVAQVQLRDREMNFTSRETLDDYNEHKLYNHSFDTGPLDATDAESGAILIGRDGGTHRGSKHDDISLDASVAQMGDGNDIVILDNETGRLADGGAGDDILIGGTAEETFIGGEGRDEIHADDGDIVEATAGHDRADTIRFEGLELSGPDGVDHPDGVLRGSHGETYSQGADGADIVVEHEGRMLTIEGASDGDFGFDLSGLLEREASLSGADGTDFAQDFGAQAPGGTTLAEAGNFLSENGNAALENLYTREAWSREEGALADALDSPATDAMLRTLGENGVERLDVEIDPAAAPEANAMGLVRAACTDINERGLREEYITTADDMARERGWEADAATHDPEHDYDDSYAIV